jgi:diacylglycerol kinase (ATP)
MSEDTKRRRIENALAELGSVPVFVELPPRETLSHTIAELLDATGSDRILVCGGDGSVGGVLAATVGTGVPVGIVPGGTGNQLARNLGIPLEPFAAVRVALDGTVVPLDLAVTDRGEWLCQMGGMGVDAKMVADVDAGRKGRWGVVAYVWAAVRHLGPHRFRARIRLDRGRPRRRKVSSILIANAGRLLGALEPIPGASPHDGVLNVGLVKSHTPVQWMRLAAALATGRVAQDPTVEIVQTTKLVIDTPRPEPFEIDGELLGSRSHVEITVHPGAARVVVPSGSAAAIGVSQSFSRGASAHGSPC